MKTLICGLGSIGRRHLRNLRQLGETDFILYRTRRSTLPDDELAGLPVETELGAALAHRPDAVVISNPTALHMDVAIPAAQAGCTLFLEKPIAHNLERVEELRQAVQTGGGQVLVGYQFRFHPGLQKIRSLLDENAIGRPLSVRAHWGEWLPGWHPWEDYRQGYSARADLGGGVILTLCHPLDYLRWLLGEVSALWCFTGHSSDLELAGVEDTAEIGLRFAVPDGKEITGSVHLNYNQRPPSHHLEIVGTHGTLRWNNDGGIVHLYRAPSDPQVHAEWESFAPPPAFERNDLFLAQMRHFLQVARGEAAPLCTLEDGIRALELALAAHQSDELGQVIRF